MLILPPKHTICSLLVFKIFKKPVLLRDNLPSDIPKNNISPKKSLEVCLSGTGNVHSISAPNRQRPGRSEDTIINVVAYVEANPHLSVRKTAI